MLRPSAYLAACAHAYPQVWAQYAQLLSGRGLDLPDWPAWCWAPLAAAHAVASGGSALPSGHGHRVGVVGALAAWRATQGVYRYDPTLAAAVAATDLDRAIPAEALERLPEWAPYLDLAGHVPGLAGAWAHLEHDVGDGRRELRLLLDPAGATPGDLDALLPIAIHLPPGGSLLDGLRAWGREALIQARAAGADGAAQSQLADLALDPRGVAKLVAPVVALALYLCAADAELASDRPRQPPTTPRQHKGRLRWDPPPGPQEWRTGFRLGAALRAATAGDGTHAGPRPHVRRAHWHTYLSGPRTGAQRRELRWLPPIAVGLADAPDAPTIREVSDARNHP